MNLPAEIKNQLADEDYEGTISGRISYILNSSVEEFSNANNAKEITNASNNYNPQAILTDLNQLIIEVENWYVGHHNQIINKACSAENISSSKWLIKIQEFSWIKNSILNQRNAIEISVNQFDGVLAACAEFAESNSGFTGFFNGVIKGLVNPLDAIRAFWGDSSIDRASNNIKTALQKSGQQLESSFKDLDQQLRASVNSAFNNLTLIALNEIHFEAERQRKLKEEEERQRKLMVEEERQRKLRKEEEWQRKLAAEEERLKKLPGGEMSGRSTKNNASMLLTIAIIALLCVVIFLLILLYRKH